LPEARVEAFVFPAIGRRPIAEVVAPELLALLRKIEARGTVETAHKVARACGQVFRYGIASGRCERNPVELRVRQMHFCRLLRHSSSALLANEEPPIRAFLEDSSQR
jgi:integrase